jgi:flagellar hook protein FlgE
MRVQGWMATDGSFGLKNSDTLVDVTIPIGKSIAGKATSSAAFGRNLDSNAATGATVTVPFEACDSLGNTHSVTLTFTKTATANQWSWAATGTGVVTGSSTGTIDFASNGSFSAESGASITVAATGAANIVINPDFSTMSQSASETGESTVQLESSNGYKPGELTSFSIDASGIITGAYSNGVSQALGEVALGYFANPSGLQKQGDNLYRESGNSGVAQVGEAGTAGRGVLAPSSLEMSNVELATEFTNMIITQRGFQANSRIITTSDEMLQELANLKR